MRVGCSVNNNDGDRSAAGIVLVVGVFSLLFRGSDGGRMGLGGFGRAGFVVWL